MRVLECWRHGRALLAALIWLCLALVGVGAYAGSAAAIGEQVGPVSSMAGMHEMSRLADCVPCAACCVASTPATHGFSGECKEPEAPVWQLHIVPIPTGEPWLDTGVEHPRVPARIAFCRWLD